MQAWQWPQRMIDSTATRSPTPTPQRFAARSPMRSITPSGSCPGTTGRRTGRTPAYCSASLPQMPHASTRRRALSSSMSGTGSSRSSRRRGAVCTTARLVRMAHPSTAPPAESRRWRLSPSSAMTVPRMQCSRYGTPFEGERVPVRGVCSRCAAFLHCCRNCERYAPGLANDGREPQAERVADKEQGNFCDWFRRSEEHTSELQSQSNLVCRLLLEKKKKKQKKNIVEYKKNTQRKRLRTRHRACSMTNVT